MNREIKFRAWDKENNIMMECECPDLLIHFDGELNSFDSNGEIIGTEFTNDMELMQYTGLKDKHGKKIYEGDIVEFHTNIITKTKAKVEFDCYGFMLNEIHDINCCYLGEIDIDDDLRIEVIGNIYENSKLLDGGK